MWYKVKELFDSGLNLSQVHRETGLDRSTVRKYRTMSEKAFHDWISHRRHLPKKLAPYYDFVLSTLEKQSFLSSPQIEDRILDHFHAMPPVHWKTIHNFVKNIRKDHDLPKQKIKDPRGYEKLPETAYGDEAQADFGQVLMQTETKYSVRIYFFVIVLSRSRQKFVYCQNYPFSTATTVYAHELAFEYFQGIPKKIIYDQDKVLLKDENLGDVILTEGFSSFISSNPFSAVFCKKADPESKGKVENVVKYVKFNFMRGRLFKNISLLQKECLDWLRRRGNGKVHGTTGKVPHKEWMLEQKHLQPLRSAPALPSSIWPEYAVRKDNCITYKGNYYSLPVGTYKAQGTKVLLEVKGSSLCIYNMSKERIVQHVICPEKGVLVRSEGHKRARSLSEQESHGLVLSLLDHPHAAQYLALLKEDKPRYYHDNLKVMHKCLNNASKGAITEAVAVCLENSIYNGYDFSQVLSACQKQEPLKQAGNMLKMPTGKRSDYRHRDMDPETSNINFYESILK